MFADPQSVTINAVANSLPRTITGQEGVASAQYTKDDTTVVLRIAHQNGKRKRHNARLDFTKLAPDPFIPSQNVQLSMSAYLVVDAPVAGFTVVEQKQIVDALVLWLSATSGANTTRLIAGES